MKNFVKAIFIMIAILAMAKFGWLAWDFLLDGGMEHAINPVARALWIGKYGVTAIGAILGTCLVDWFWKITEVKGC